MRAEANRHRLGDLARFVSGGTPSKQIAAYWGGDTPWVSAKDLKSLRISSSIDRLSDAGKSMAVLVPEGTLLLLVRGMSLFKGIPLGIAARELAINQDLKGLIVKGNVSPLFLAYTLLSHEEALMQMVEAAGHGTGRLDTDSLKDLVVRVPSRKEQDRIVDVLTCWDIAIAKTDKLIAAKERSSKGVMQRLLRGTDHPRHRLSEFVSRVVRKNTTGNNYPLTISGRDGLISQAHYFDKRIAAEATEHYTLLKRGEFAYNRSYSSGNPFGAIKRLDAYDEGIVSTLYLCFALKPDAPLLSDYLTHYCESGEFNHQIHNVAQEGARNHGLLNVAANDFFGMTMPLPPLKQQQRIADALDAARAEIELLKKQLAALREQKRGLMQKLLTGQWHLKTAEKAAA